MLGAHITLFRLLGFEVKVDLSWVFLALLVTWSLAQGYFPANYPDLVPQTYWWMGIVGALGLFASIIFHELSHSIVARRFDLQIRGITLFIFGGVAEMESEPPTPRAEFMMAIAGPIASLGLAAFFYLAAGWSDTLNATPAIVGVTHYLSLVNLLLALFNMVPAFPLDGGRALRAFLWSRSGNIATATRTSARIGQTFGTVLIVLGLYALFTGNTIAGLWWGLIGLFLHGASRASYTQVHAHQLLEHEPVERVMTPDPLTVPADITLRALVEDYIYRSFHETFPVMDGGKVIGIIGVAQLRGLDAAQWDHTRVRDRLVPLSPQTSVTSSTGAEDALKIMHDGGHTRLLVLNPHGALIGIVALRDILRLISLKTELEERR